MTIPFHKRILSYLFDVHVESRKSDFNPVLDVVISRGRYQLCTANAIYSFEDLYDNFRRAFDLIHVRDLPIESVLVLGLGLGSIPVMLENKYQRTFDYTVVEIDEEVAHLAHKYALHEMKSSVETIIADAHAFIMQNEKKYDLICMDVFVDDVIPNKFQNESFLEVLRAALTADGILLYNRLARTKNDLALTDAFFNGPFRSRFPEAHYLDVNGNWMLMNRQVSSA